MATRKKAELMELVVAQLISEGRSRTEIASKLEISATRVSQLLKENPHLTMVYKPSLIRSERGLIQEAKKLLGRANLSEKVSSLSPPGIRVKVTVIYDRDSEEKARPTFTKQTAQAISRCLTNSKIVGVCGGVTIKPQAKSASFFQPRDPSKGDKPIRFIPLCGFTHLKSEATRFSSTMVALRFEEIFNAKFESPGHHPQNMNCLTLYSPYRKEEGLAENELFDEGVKKYIGTYFSGYEEIFGAEDNRNAPLIDEAGTMITGIGAASQKQYAYLDPHKEGYIYFPCSTGLPPISIEQLKSNVICGDIGGIFLPKENSNEDHYTKKVVEYLNSRLTTLNARHLSACAKSAHASGVVCIAFGAHKKEVVLQAIKHGYINRLIIDDALADALKAL